MNSTFEAVLRRDRAIVIAALAIITTLAWADIIWLADDMAMGGMDMTGFRMIPAGQGLMMPASAPWQPIEFAYVFAMWAVMMIGMMTPSVAPMILIYARVGRQAVSSGHPFAASGWVACGYLTAWLGFSLAATSAQWVLERAALLTPMMESASAVLGGTVLIAAGIYQWTPVKEACLEYALQNNIEHGVWGGASERAEFRRPGAVTRRPPSGTAEGVRIALRATQLSIEKAQRELGYAPRPIEPTLRDTIAFLLRARGKIPEL